MSITVRAADVKPGDVPVLPGEWGDGEPVPRVSWAERRPDGKVRIHLLPVAPGLAAWKDYAPDDQVELRSRHEA